MKKIKTEEPLKVIQLDLKIYGPKEDFWWQPFFEKLQETSLNELQKAVDYQINSVSTDDWVSFEYVYMANPKEDYLSDSEIISSLKRVPPHIPETNLTWTDYYISALKEKGNADPRKWWNRNGYTLNMWQVKEIISFHLKNPGLNILLARNIFYVRNNDGGIVTLCIWRSRRKKWKKDKFQFAFFGFDSETHGKSTRLFFGTHVNDYKKGK